MEPLVAPPVIANTAPAEPVSGSAATNLSVTSTVAPSDTAPPVGAVMTGASFIPVISILSSLVLLPAAVSTATVKVSVRTASFAMPFVSASSLSSTYS